MLGEGSSVCSQSTGCLRGVLVPEKANRQLVCYYTCSTYTKSELVESVYGHLYELAVWTISPCHNHIRTPLFNTNHNFAIFWVQIQ